MFKRKTKLEKILDKRINYVTFRDFLKSLSHKELHILAEEIIWKEYDGYNGSSCRTEQNYYDLMDRWQKLHLMRMATSQLRKSCLEVHLFQVVRFGV